MTTLTDSPPWPSDQPPAREYCDESNRLRVLASFDVDGLEGDPELARLARFAARLCNAPSAAISLVEKERQRFIASEGLESSGTPRATSFCAHAMLGDDLFEVLDA
ncbi:MAG: PAS domain S-box protein, partial [Pseudomonadota bacterium]